MAVEETSQKSITNIIMKEIGYLTLVHTPGIANVTILNLKPSTHYFAYCYTESLRGDSIMSSKLIAQTQTQISTHCCRALFFMKSTISTKEFTGSDTTDSSPTTITFSMDALPSYRLNISVHISPITHNCNNSLESTTSPIAKITPDYFTFHPSSLSSIGKFIISYSTPGCYNIQLIADPSPLNYYEPANMTLLVSSSLSPPNTPVLISAQFSNDGNKLIFEFDSSTNQGAGLISNFASSFACSHALVFSGASTALCKWSSNTTIVATPDSSSLNTLPNILDIVSVKANVIQAYCSPRIVCTDFVSSLITVSISPPSSPISPTVSLSAASIATVCDRILVDPTASRGRAGRDWKIIKWSIVSSNNNVTDLENHINKSPSTSSILVIPVGLVSVGRYDLTLSLENYFSKSFASTVTIEVVSNSTAPTVRLSTANLIQLKRSGALEVSAIASMSSCSGLQTSGGGVAMVYSWQLYRQYLMSLVPQSNIKSVSLDPRVFKLNSQTLTSNIQYVLTITARLNTAVNSASSTSTSVIIQVISSGILARIAGGSERTASIGDTSIIDASTSRDLDYPDENSALKFSWNCVDLGTQNYGGDCDIVTNSLSLPVLSISFKSSNTSQYNRYYNFSVHVSNNYGSVAIAVTAISVKTTTVPIVSLGAVQAKYNPSNKILLNGTIQSSEMFWAKWSATIASSGADVPLDSISSTPISYNSVSAGISTFQLSITPNSLTPGLTYIFKLLADYYYSENDNATSSHSSSYSQNSIVINTPPFGGSLSVAPLEGQSLLTTFDLLTSLWVDDAEDYPFTYSFEYYSLFANVKSSIQARSGSSYTSGIISQGLLSSNYSITCLTTVFDAFSSSSSVSFSIRVLPPNSNTAELQTALGQHLLSAFSNSDANAVSQVLSAVTSSLNVVDCSEADSSYCESINRFPCSSKSNTCGMCLSSKFLGVQGDFNIPCIVKSASLKVANEDCSSNSECTTGLCEGGQCSYSSKACPNNCTSLSNGVCRYYDKSKSSSTEIITNTCKENNRFCEAKCDCQPGYSSSDCSLTTVNALAARSMRELMCVSVYKRSMIQDATEDVLQSQCSIIVNLLIDPMQASDYAIGNCTAALAETLNRTSDSNGVQKSVPIITSALSNILKTGQGLSNSTKSQIDDILIMLTKIVQSQLAVGETPELLVSDSLRMVIAMVDPSLPAAFTLPQTDFESFNKFANPSVSLNASLGSSDSYSGRGVAVSSVLGGASPSGTESQVISIAQSFQSSTSSAVSSNASSVRRSLVDSSSTTVSTTFKIVLVNKNDADYSTQNLGRKGTIECSNRGEGSYNISIFCSAGIGGSANITCPGNTNRLFSYECPSFVKIPVCKSAESDGVFTASQACVVESYNVQTTTCKCTVYHNSTGDDNYQITSSIELVGDNFANTWTGITTISLSNVERNPSILVTITFYVGAFIIGLTIFLYKDYHEFKQVQKKKKVISEVAYSDINMFFNSALTPQFSGKAWYEIFYKKLGTKHDLFCFIYPFDGIDREFRSTRWAKIMCRTLNFLWVDVFLSKSFTTDDGSCNQIRNQEDCLVRKSLDQIDSLCIWNKDIASASSPHCVFNPDYEGSSILGVLILTALIVLFSIPFNKGIEFVITQVRKFCVHRMMSRSLHRSIYATHTATSSNIVDDDEKSKKYSMSALSKVQTLKTKFFLGMRLLLMQNSMDNCTSEEESDFILTHGGKRFSVVSLSIKTKNDDLTRKTYLGNYKSFEISMSEYYTSFIKTVFDDYYIEPFQLALNSNFESLDQARDKIIRLVDESRYCCDKIVQRMSKLPSAHEQERYLVRSFITFNMSTAVKKKLAKDGLFPEFQYGESSLSAYVRSTSSSLVQYACVLILPFYVFGFSTYLFLFGLRLGDTASQKWLLGAMLSLAIDVVFMVPFKIWMKWIVISSAANSDIRSLHGLLRERSTAILTRTRGTIKNYNSLTQHFNPACRAARMYPHLPVARLLMSLNDFDLPVNYTRKTRSFLEHLEWMIGAFIMAFLLIWAIFPDFFQDIFGGLLFTSGIAGIVAFGIFLNSAEGGKIVISIVVCIIVFLLLRREYRSAKLRSQFKAALAPVNIVDIDEFQLDDERSAMVNVLETFSAKKVIKPSPSSSRRRHVSTSKIAVTTTSEYRDEGDINLDSQMLSIPVIPSPSSHAGETVKSQWNDNIDIFNLDHGLNHPSSLSLQILGTKKIKKVLYDNDDDSEMFCEIVYKSPVELRGHGADDWDMESMSN